MGQMGFFDLGNRYSGLDAKNEPLLKIDGVVPWEDLRARLEAVWRRADKARKSRAGRKPWDAIVMFKTIILCALYNLSDDQVEHQIRDRLSFMRFLGLGLEGRVPDAKTVWLYREQLTQAGVIEALFETFDGYLKDQGYLAMGGQIIDASIVAVPKQRNSREENARIKAGETPAGWEDKPAKRRQKDVEARWTKKHGKSHYGYKNHVNVDRRHKLLRRYHVSDAAEHGVTPQKWSRFVKRVWRILPPRKEDKMSRKRYTPEQIISMLREAEVALAQGQSVGQACRTLGVSEQSYYRWRKEYGGLRTDQAKRLKDLERENGRLRKAISDLTLDKLILKEALEGNC